MVSRWTLFVMEIIQSFETHWCCSFLFCIGCLWWWWWVDNRYFKITWKSFRWIKLHKILIINIILALFYLFRSHCRDLRCLRNTIHANLFLTYILTSMLWLVPLALGVSEIDSIVLFAIAVCLLRSSLKLLLVVCVCVWVGAK